MYSREKPQREDKSKTNPPNPRLPPTHASFSSTLLDEIYRSIDGGNDYRDRIPKKQSNGNGGGMKAKKASSAVDDEEAARFRRAILVEKWMENKVSARRRQSMPEFDRKSEKLGSYELSEDYPFGEIPQRKTREDLQREDGLMKSKLRALKIYNNLKKVKQPISPGGKLASFLNSLFTNGGTKKSKKNPNGGYDENWGIERKSNSTQASTCSSASSYSRSCLSKTSQNSKEKTDHGVKRSVKFYPVSVIVGEDCRPCGHKCLYTDDCAKFGSKTKKEINNVKVVAEKRGKIEVATAAREILNGYGKNDLMARNQNSYDEDEGDDYDDAASDSSSDLFELDHLAFIGNDNGRHCEELPVYETTHLGMNRAIASGLIR